MVFVSEVAWYPFSWRHLSVVTLDALTPASVKSLWSSPKCLHWLCLTVFSSLRSFLICLCTFSHPISSFQSTLHLICFDTALCGQPPLLLITFCDLLVEGVSDFLLYHCQVTNLPHYFGLKKQEIPGIYTVGMVIWWNSNVNIIIFWNTGFLTFVSSNQKKKKKTFEMFYFTCNESRIYESFTFWNVTKKKNLIIRDENGCAV